MTDSTVPLRYSFLGLPQELVSIFSSHSQHGIALVRCCFLLLFPLALERAAERIGIIGDLQHQEQIMRSEAKRSEAKQSEARLKFEVSAS